MTVSLPLATACQSTPPAPPASTAASATTAPTVQTAPGAPAATSTPKPVASAVAAAPARTGGTLTYAAKSDVFTLNPLMHTDTTTHTVLGNAFEALVDINSEGKFQGVLAEMWEVLDPQTVRFALRKGVKFHNGEDFTAESVKFSVDFARDPNVKSPAGPTLDVVDDVTTPDPYTAVVKFKKPYAAYLTVMYFAWLLPPKYFQQVGATEFAKKPVGTGPFVFSEWRKDVQVVMEANPNHWRGKPGIDRLVYRPIPEDSSRVAALQNGEIDLAFAAPIDRLRELEGSKDLRVASRPGQMIYAGLDTLKTEALKDRRVRQALNYAVDVDSIVKNLFDDRAVRVNGALFPTSPGYDQSMAPYKYDPEKARALLNEAGYGSGLEIRLDTPVGIQASQRLKEVAQVLTENLQKVGVTAKINIMEPAAGFDKYRAREFQMYLFAWGSSPESGRHIDTLLHSKTRGYYYQNPEADRLIDTYMTTLEPDKRIAAGRDLQRYLQDDAPWVYLYLEPDLYGVRQRVQWEPNQADFRFQAYQASLKA
jgi:peptide/nickel transport system substrate-binding protein